MTKGKWRREVPAAAGSRAEPRSHVKSGFQEVGNLRKALVEDCNDRSYSLRGSRRLPCGLGLEQGRFGSRATGGPGLILKDAGKSKPSVMLGHTEW